MNKYCAPEMVRIEVDVGTSFAAYTIACFQAVTWINSGGVCIGGTGSDGEQIVPTTDATDYPVNQCWVLSVS